MGQLDYVTRGTLLAQALYRMLSKPSHLLCSHCSVAYDSSAIQHLSNASNFGA